MGTRRRTNQSWSGCAELVSDACNGAFSGSMEREFGNHFWPNKGAMLQQGGGGKQIRVTQLKCEGMGLKRAFARLKFGQMPRSVAVQKNELSECSDAIDDREEADSQPDMDE